MKILEQIDTLAANVTSMTIKRAKHFCNLYEAMYVVICDFGNPVSEELVTRMHEIRKLKNSITDYETGKAITIDKAFKVLGAIDATS